MVPKENDSITVFSPLSNKMQGTEKFTGGYSKLLYRNQFRYVSITPQVLLFNSLNLLKIKHSLPIL